MRDGFPANFLDPSNIVAQPPADPRRRIATARGRWCSSSAAASSSRSAATSSPRWTSSGRSTDHLAVLRNLNQNLPGTLDANGPLPYPTFGNVQWREMTGDAQLQGHGSVVREAVQQAATATGRRTRSARRAIRRRSTSNASSGRPQNGRDLESWEGPSDFDIRHRFVGQLHRRAAVRRRQGVRAGRRRREDPRRLDGERDLQRPHGPADDGHAGQQQRRRRHDRPAEPDRRPEGRRRRWSSGSTRRRSRRCRRARSATPAATSCAGPAG